MSRHRTARRGRRGGSALALALAGLGALFLTHAVTAPRGPVVLASTTLTSAPLGSTGGGSLFSVAGLTPGHPVSRCVTVSGVGANTPVLFAADGVHGGLAPYLRLAVTPGTGTDGACADFSATGSAVFSGTLDDPAVSVTAGGISTGWTAAAGETRTFELAVDVLDDPAALGATVTADFVWSTGTPPVPVPPVTPTVTPSVVPTVTPTVVPTVSPTIVPTVPPTVEPSANPTPVPVVRPTPETSVTPTRPPDARPTSVPVAPQTGAPTQRPTVTPTPVMGTPTTSVRAPENSAAPSTTSSATAVPAGTPTRTRSAGGAQATTTPSNHAPIPDVRTEQVRDVAVAVVRYGSFPLLLLVLVVLYLFVQNRIDRRDPKLVAAPVRSTPEQELPDEGAVPWQKS